MARAWMASVLAVVAMSGCGGTGSSSSSDGGTSGALSCSDWTGSWRQTAWSCAGTPVDLAAAGVELTMAFSTATSGLHTTKFFVPVGQTTTWYARTGGRTVSASGANVTFSAAAPRETCSTNAGAVEWGPITVGTGQSSTCKTQSGAPGTPESTTLACSVAGSTLTLTVTSNGQYGPCSAGQASIETWTRQ